MWQLSIVRVFCQAYKKKNMVINKNIVHQLIFFSKWKKKKEKIKKKKKKKKNNLSVNI